MATWTRLEDTAVALFPISLFFYIAFAGFIVRLPTMPGYLKGWAPPVSFARWALEVRALSLIVPSLFSRGAGISNWLRVLRLREVWWRRRGRVNDVAVRVSSLMARPWFP